MKKIIILSLMIIIFLTTGCSGLYNLNNFILPDDLEFMNIVENLQTPKEICQYMLDNFGNAFYPSITLTPYELFLNKKGDCNDFSNFAVFIANYHGYETYQIVIKFFGCPVGHTIGIFKEEDFYNISDMKSYIECNCESFEEIMELYPDYNSYIVYDFDLNIIETIYK